MAIGNFACLVVAAVLAAPLLSVAQTWPQRTVKLVLPLGAGAGADISARLLSERLAKRWGQPVVVENRPGGDGVVAINAVLTARDDHTFLYGPTSSFVGHPYLLEKLPYDPSELLPVARVSNTVVCMAVPASLNVGSLKELMAMARQQPRKLNWATVTGVTDIIFAGYMKSAGLDMVQVPYRDTVTALNDLVEGRIQLYAGAYAIMRSQAQAGRIKVLAVTNRSRAPSLADIVTVAEGGFPELSFDGLVGVIAARASGITDAVRERIAADVKVAALDPVIVERLAGSGQIISPGTPTEFATAIDEQAGHLGTFAKALGIKPHRSPG